MSQFIISKTPLRISLFGGGTDFQNHFNANKSSVTSFTINKFIYTIIKSHDNNLFDEKYRLNYSSVENTKDIKFINNNIIKNTLTFKRINYPLYISTISDVPGGTGLGSSSSFTVGLLNALNKFKNQKCTNKQLARQATHIEINMCKSPIGFQDQYAAAYGGINKINFFKNNIYVNNLNQYSKKINNLINNSICLWIGNVRHANDLLKLQNKNNLANKAILLEVSKLNSLFLKHLISSTKIDIEYIGNLLERSWSLKKNFTSNITNKKINSIIKLLNENGSMGSKVLGAGGGGFIFSIIPKQKKTIFLNKYKNKFYNLDIKLELNGSKII